MNLQPPRPASRRRPFTPVGAAAVLLACLGPGAASAQDPEPDRRGAKAALQFVFRNATMPLPDNASCRGVDTTGIVNPTIGDWLSGVLAEFPPAAGRSGVVAGCTGEVREQRCHVLVQRASGEEVWRWGVHFTADGTTGGIERNSIRCDMAG